jgi:peptidyl-prolyl cis-trans isomerase D
MRLLARTGLLACCRRSDGHALAIPLADTAARGRIAACRDELSTGGTLYQVRAERSGATGGLHADMAKNRVLIWLRNAALGLVIVAFVAWGPNIDTGGARAVATVRGEEIPRELFEFAREGQRGMEQRLRDLGQRQRDVRDQIDRIVVDELVRLYIFSQEAKRFGLDVSEDEIKRAICSALRPDPCEQDVLDSIIRQSGIGSQQRYVDLLRRQILNGKLEALVGEPVRVSRATAVESLRQQQTLLKLAYVKLDRQPPSSDAPDVTEDEVTSFAEAEPGRISATYELRRGEFEQPEQVRARQILFMGEGAAERAAAAKARIEAGEAFADVARELSQDPATAPNGGDVGFFPRGRLDPAFEEAAFGAEIGAVVGPVETPRGQFLLTVEERRTEVKRSLEEMTPELARDLLRQDRAEAQARKQADELLEALASGSTLAAAAEERGLTVSETASFARVSSRVPGLPSLPGLVQATRSLTRQGAHIPTVFESPDAYYVIALAELTEPDAERLEKQADMHRNTMTAQAQRLALDELYISIRKEVERSNDLTLYSLYES